MNVRMRLLAFALTLTLVQASALAQPSSFRAIFFLATDCPISQQYTREIKLLQEKFRLQVEFSIIIKSSPYQKSDSIARAFMKTYSLNLPYSTDPTGKMAKEMGATITPEVFFLSGDGHLLYHGAIDNWFYALGKNRLSATEHYLQDAIKQALAGEKISKPFVKAVGCFIEY